MLGSAGYNSLVQEMRMKTLQMRGSYDYHIFFTDVTELEPIDQFLLSCGPLNDMEQAKEALPYVLHQIRISGLKPDGSVPNICDIKVRGYSLNAIEWAARRGNYEIAEWLATDERTKVMLTQSDSAPVAWACYTNKVELAKMLVKNGANSKATTEAVFGYKPATHLAAESGSFLALKFLIEKCGHDIHECDTFGNDIRAAVRVNNKAWTQVAGCVASDEYATELGVDGDIKTRKTKVIREDTTPKSVMEVNLANALNNLKVAGGKEEEDDDEDEHGEGFADPSTYVEELLAVADARYELGQYEKAGDLYHTSYYATIRKSHNVNDPAIFPIAHKMTLAWMKSEDENTIKYAHGMAQQNCNMPGHPVYIREDLKKIEKLMKRKGIKVERFGSMMF